MLEKGETHYDDTSENIIFAGIRSVVSSAEIRTNSKGIRCLVIKWARPDFEALIVREDELETPLFNHALYLLGDIEVPGAAAGIVLDIVTDASGNAISIGRERHETVSIRETLIKMGYLSE